VPTSTKLVVTCFKLHLLHGTLNCSLVGVVGPESSASGCLRILVGGHAIGGRDGAYEVHLLVFISTTDELEVDRWVAALSEPARLVFP
jgi:hypothetical protein